MRINSQRNEKMLQFVVGLKQTSQNRKSPKCYSILSIKEKITIEKV